MRQAIRIALAVVGLCTVSAGQNISTVAGMAWPVGDGGPATSAQVSGPRGLAFDLGGNLYIADTWHHRVRKVTYAGVITTVAGTGDPGYSGDGGPATAAQLYSPAGIAVDSSGNLYIADLNNHCIRKVNPAGVISTVAGTGVAGYNGEGTATAQNLYFPAGLALDAADDLYIADMGNNRVRKLAVRTGQLSTVAGDGFYGYYGEDGQPATRASLAWPADVALDLQGNLYIADTENHRIRKVMRDTGIISTVAGTGTRGFSGDGGPATAAQISFPHGVAYDGGSLFISDWGNDRVRRVDPSGTISTLAGSGSFGFSGDNGPATAAALASPWGIAVDSAGNTYIANADGDRVRRVSRSTGLITTWVGTGTVNSLSGDNGPATAARLSGPLGVATDTAGNLYIADTYNNRVRKVDAAGMITTVAGNGFYAYTGDGGAGTAASLAWPRAVAVDSAGNLYIADTGNHRVRKLVKATSILTTVAGTGTAGYGGDGGNAAKAYLHSPRGVAVDAAGNLYIVDTDNNRVRKASAAGIMSTLAGSGTYGFAGDGGSPLLASLASPSGVAVDPDGNVYIADTENQRIRKVSGSLITTVAGGGRGAAGDGGLATLARLYFPAGVAVNPAFDLYIADQDNNRVRMVTAPARFSYGYQKGSVPPTIMVERGGSVLFGETRMGAPVTVKFIILNTSGSTQTLRSVSVTGAGYSTQRLPSLPRSLANGAQLDFDLVFLPASFGLYAGMLTVDGVPLQLVGTGLGDPLSFDCLPFGKLPAQHATVGNPIQIPDTSVGRSTKVQFWVTNTSGSPQTVQSISISGAGFGLARLPSLPRSLTASGTGVQFDFDIVFSPAAAAAYTGTLTIDGRVFPLTSNAGNIYLYQYLKGGAQPAVTAAPGGTVQFPDAAQGGSSKVQFWVTNNTARPQTVYDISVSGAGFSLARVPSLPVNLTIASPGVQFDFDVVYAPTAVGSGTGTLTINGDSFTLSAKGILGPVTITGLASTVQPAQQPAITVQLSRAPGVTLTGTAALAFASTAVNSRDDPNIKISGATGTGRSLNFTVCATCTSYQFNLASTGTVAGAIAISVGFAAGTTDVSPAPIPTVSGSVPRQAPVLTNVRILNRTTSGFDVEVTGYSTTRDLTQAVFTFSGTNLGATSFPVSLTTDSATWFGGSTSTQYGGSFKYTQSFSATQGNANNVTSVSVTLANSSGTSTPRSGS
jgi:hypothetical protein